MIFLKELVELQTKHNNVLSQINLFPYNDPNDSYIEYEKVLLQYENTEDMIKEIFKLLYCNIKHKENHSILKTNINNPYFRVFNGKEWIVETKNIFLKLVENIQMLVVTRLQEKQIDDSLLLKIEKIQEYKSNKVIHKTLTAMIYNFSQTNNM